MVGWLLACSLALHTESTLLCVLDYSLADGFVLAANKCAGLMNAGVSALSGRLPFFSLDSMAVEFS